MSTGFLDELELEDNRTTETNQQETPPPAPAAGPAPEAKLTKTGTSNTGKGGFVVPDDFKSGKLDGICAHCGVEMRNILGIMTADGPVHNDCIPAYKRLRLERCGHCDCVLPPGKRSIVAGIKLHPDCVADFKAKKPYVPPTRCGEMRKFAVGRSFFGKKNWQTRYFRLSKEDGLSYWERKDEADANKPAKGKIVLDNRTRLITHPNRMIHREATNPSNHFIVVFYESTDPKAKEFSLLCECKGWQEHDEWTRTLEAYVKHVDDPRDVKETP